MARTFNPWYGCVGVIAVTAGVLVTANIVHANEMQTIAQAEARQYTPPPLPTPQAVTYVDVVGDSYTAGSGMDSGAASEWPALVAAKLNVQILPHAVGGSGYIATNPAAGDTSTFEDRAALVSSSSQVILFFGGRNDAENSGEALYRAAFDSYRAAEKINPDATVVVVGIPWVDSTPPAGITANEAELHRAAVAAHATWVDPLAAGWFPTGSGMIGEDGVHPTDAGHKHLAALLEPILQGALR